MSVVVTDHTPRAAAAPAVQQSIDIFYLPCPLQQTRRTLLRRANGPHEWTDGTDTVPFNKLRGSAYYAGNVKM